MTEVDETQIWKLCDKMREEGIDKSDYVSQISPFLLLKGAEVNPQVKEEDFLPSKVRWKYLLDAAQNPSNENNIIDLYEDMIEELKTNNEYSMANSAFFAFQNQFKMPKVLRELVKGVDDTLKSDTEQDVLGDAYEYVLEKDAEKGSGEYFTPRPVINAMVEVTDPDYDDSILDPAAGTNGFIIGAYQYLGKKYGEEYEGDMLRFMELEEGYDESNLHLIEKGNETYRLGLMNLLLHGINPENVNHAVKSSLANPPKEYFNEEFDIVLANPPFGSEVSIKYDRGPDSSESEFQFFKLIMDSLSKNGKAAVVVPEGVLFNDAIKHLRKDLLEYYNVNCILTLPEDSFQPYAGVEANIIFFERDNDGTDELWYYDCRTDFENIKKSNPLTYSKHLEDFVETWDTREESENYFKVKKEEIVENDYALHYKKYKDFNNQAEYDRPGEILDDISCTVENIEERVQELENIYRGDNK